MIYFSSDHSLSLGIKTKLLDKKKMAIVIKCSTITGLHRNNVSAHEAIDLHVMDDSIQHIGPMCMKVTFPRSVPEELKCEMTWPKNPANKRYNAPSPTKVTDKSTKSDMRDMSSFVRFCWICQILSDLSDPKFYFSWRVCNLESRG